MRRNPLLVSILVVIIAATVVSAKTQRLGDVCNWEKNCQKHVDGAGPDWAGGEVTCAVPADHKPETCGWDDKKRRNDFYGTCKAVGRLEPNEYGCGCGVHGGDCPRYSPFSRIFWPADWLAKTWGS